MLAQHKQLFSLSADLVNPKQGRIL